MRTNLSKFICGAVTIAWMTIFVPTAMAGEANEAADDTMHRQHPRVLGESERQNLLAAREEVWRAWFAGDSSTLEKVIPEELVGINWDGGEWSTREVTIEQAEEFAAAGGHLIALSFPRTEIQVYGDIAILYSDYKAEVEENGQVSRRAGRSTEVFVWRDGRWVNSGWHVDSGA